MDDFKGETFVAFLDISGFKKLMKDDKRALEAIDTFYSAGYEILDSNNRTNGNNKKIGGVFVSDSEILFYKENLKESSIDEKKSALCSLLDSIKYINRKMCDKSFTLTTSIAYGCFKFQDRIETSYIRKNAVYGNAYVTSVLDQENGTPKIQPGQCRIVTEKIDGVLNNLEFLRPGSSNDKHYYYYWMVDRVEDINEFEEDYKDYDDLAHKEVLRVLKKHMYGYT